MWEVDNIKNLKSMIVCSLITIFGLLFHINNVFAETLTMESMDGYYFTRVNHNTGATYSDHFHRYSFDNGRYAYCLEPGVFINSFYYTATNDLSTANLSQDVINRITLISHYGYDYVGHRTDKYYIATQNLIWKAMGNFTITITTGPNGTGNIVDMSAEENEIMNLVNSHYVRPSFNNKTQEVKVGETVTFTDSNNVLSQYQVAEVNGDVNYSINGNSITIKANKIGDISIKLNRKNENITSSIIYHGTNSQMMGSFSLLDPSRAYLNIKVVGGVLSISKTGEELEYADNSYKYNNIPLKDVKYNLYAEENIYDGAGRLVIEKGAKINYLITDENGLTSISNLYFGKYYIQEEKSSNNNLVDDNKYSFEVSITNPNANLELNNYLAKGTLDFSKIDISTSEALPNTKIQIFTEDDILIYEGVTDEDGKIVISDLPVGKFYIVESEAPEDYILNPAKMYFEIKENNEIVRCTMTNERIFEVEVPKTGSNNYSFIIVSIIMVMLTSLFGVKYAKEK